ncbi:hypothetical protein SEA_RICKMORE_9 [Gordonia phage Rickmore]|uniref:Uncharacterized protein n=1 Tax=Gordonia phage Rickmore TaxID=2507854 RepID=A0A410TBE3_9CAUD|nr:hypothetical protein HWC05_gp09 [Gordonia phage Rickmore]QAU06244.1 hypothetical protein SEA_RICKMORE_9 [Gordonia phage Rickmore]
MTFLQAASGHRVFQNFDSVPDGAMPNNWLSRILQQQGPEVRSGYFRSSQTTSNNTNSRSMVASAESVWTEDQIIRGTTRTVVNGLLSGLFLRSDAALINCVLVIITTDDNQRGIYSMIDGVTTKRASYSPRYKTGETWALKAEGNIYTLIQNPNFDNSGGTVLASWDDETRISLRGTDQSYGGFFLNSDRNAFGSRNYSAGLDDYDFRDLSWTP